MRRIALLPLFFISTLAVTGLAGQKKYFKSQGKSHFVGRDCGGSTLKKDLGSQSRVEAFKNASQHCRPMQAVRVSPWIQEVHKNESRFGCDMSGSASAKFDCL